MDLLLHRAGNPAVVEVFGYAKTPRNLLSIFTKLYPKIRLEYRHPPAKPRNEQSSVAVPDIVNTVEGSVHSLESILGLIRAGTIPGCHTVSPMCHAH